jgi:AraC family transcriptional regulator
LEQQGRSAFVIIVSTVEDKDNVMNYSEDIKRSIDFIEAHIKETLTAREIAGRAGYSVFHFCRIFAAEQHISLMDYTRKRRLALARQELLTGEKIIDIAIGYGYDTPGGFTRAFHKEFGYSPSKYLARMKCHAAISEIDSIGGDMMEPVIVKKPAFKVAGYGIKTDIEGSFTKDIAAYWTNYSGENLATKMYDLLKPPRHGEVGICATSRDDKNVTYLLGVIVNDFSKVTPEMMTINVPAATYAVFTTPPADNSGDSGDDLAKTVRDTWKYIFEKWFENSGYVFDESKLDFEFYDERCHSHKDSVMDIYVPVKKKIR